LQETSAAQQLAVQRAQRTAEEAEDKLKLLRKWERELDNLSDPLIKQIEQLNGFLTTDMVRAVAYLTQIVGTLDAYAAVDKPRAATSDIVTPASDNKGNPSA
jgi:small-conductance mechanosensitive channel